MDLSTQKTQCFQMTKDQINDIEGTSIENTRTCIQLAVNVAPNHVLVVSENDIVCLYFTVFDDTVERCRMHQTALLEACSRWLQTLGSFCYLPRFVKVSIVENARNTVAGTRD
jgi:hypothetical protein